MFDRIKKTIAVFRKNRNEMTKRREAKRKNTKCWEAADILMMLGKGNKKAQKHLDFAIDEICLAARIFRKKSKML